MICSSCKCDKKSDGKLATEREIERQKLLSYGIYLNFAEKFDLDGLTIYFTLATEDGTDVISAIINDKGDGCIEVVNKNAFNLWCHEKQFKALDVLSYYVSEGIKYFGK